MLTSDPLISVLIASFNHGDFIGEAVESIWKQPYKNIEIIVVDDCSTDSSATLLTEMKARSPLPFHLEFNKENLGVTRTMNKALSRAGGELVTTLGSDDKFAEDRFTAQLDKFKGNDKLKAVFGECRVLRGDQLAEITGSKQKGEFLASTPQKILHELYTRKSPFLLQGALFETAFLRAVGGFDEALLSDDWPLMIRMFEKIREPQEYCYVPDVVAYYRVHESNSFKNFERHSRLKLEVIEKYTPESYKSEAYGNVHYIISRWALAARLYRTAAYHFFLSQRYSFNIRRMSFAAKFCRTVILNGMNSLHHPGARS